MKSAFRQDMDTLSAKTAAALTEEYRKARFNYGTQNNVRLRKALATQRLHHLQDTTLLSPEVHKLHATRLTQRYLKKVATVQRFVRQQQQKLVIANKRNGMNLDTSSLTAHGKIHCLTVLHDVEVLNVEAALRMVHVFKKELQTIIERSRGVWCLGVVEVEVISMEMMRQLKDQDDSEERKIAVCESMVNRLPVWYRAENAYFLIHFHGLVVAKKERDFTDLGRQLRAQWHQ